jgi:hypothetical protein
MPDTFDLDAAFRHLEHDVAGISGPRGATLAISTSRRRRRRTTIGAVVAGVALVVSSVAVAGIGHRDDAVMPVDHLPAPAPFDGPHLTAATSGWTPPWGPETKPVREEIALTFGGHCLANIPGGQRGALMALASVSRTGALAVMADFGSRPRGAATSWQRVEQQLERCPEAHLVSSFRLPSGGLGHTYRIDPSGSETAPEYAWIVTTGHQVGELKIFGQSDPLPGANDPRVARAFLAALQEPSSYVIRHTGSSTAAPRVDEQDFARALGGWVSGWKASGGEHTVGDAPCYAKHWWQHSWTSSHGGLGGNGRQDIALFHSAAAARAAVSPLSNAFRSCEGNGYAVARPVDNPRSTIVVASGPTVVWVTRHDNAVAVVRIPSAGTAPPLQVIADVGGLMLAAVTAFTAEVH